jgi:hypothetical protein
MPALGPTPRTPPLDTSEIFSPPWTPQLASGAASTAEYGRLVVSIAEPRWSALATLYGWKIMPSDEVILFRK